MKSVHHFLHMIKSLSPFLHKIIVRVLHFSCTTDLSFPTLLMLSPPPRPAPTTASFTFLLTAKSTSHPAFLLSSLAAWCRVERAQSGNNNNKNAAKLTVVMKILVVGKRGDSGCCCLFCDQNMIFGRHYPCPVVSALVANLPMDQLQNPLPQVPTHS